MPTLNKFNKTHIEKYVLPLQASMPAGTQQYFWHPSVHGLGLKLTPQKAVYIVQRRVGKKNTRIVIGGYRELTVADAEEKASALSRAMREGVDPVADKKAPRADSKTLQTVLDDYLAQYATKLRPKTRDVYKSAVRRCFADWLDVPIVDIDDDMVAEKHIAISNAHGPRGKGEAQANQAMRVLRTLFNFAMVTYKDGKKQPLITANPVQALKSRRLWNEAVCRDDIIDDDDLTAWYQSVTQLDNATVRDYILLCLFTGLRRSEAAKLTWDNVRLGKKPVLTIAPEDTKTNKVHHLPLPAFIVAMLEARDKVRRIDNRYVFPGEKAGTHIVEPKRAIARVVEQSGVDFSMHSLRRTFGTIAGKLDISHYKHKMLMNHSMKTEVTSAHYVKLSTEDLREPMEKIAAFLCDRLGVQSDTATKEMGS